MRATATDTSYIGTNRAAWQVGYQPSTEYATAVGNSALAARTSGYPSRSRSRQCRSRRPADHQCGSPAGNRWGEWPALALPTDIARPVRASTAAISTRLAFDPNDVEQWPTTPGTIWRKVHEATNT